MGVPQQPFPDRAHGAVVVGLGHRPGEDVGEPGGQGSGALGPPGGEPLAAALALGQVLQQVQVLAGQRRGELLQQQVVGMDLHRHASGLMAAS